MSQSALKANAEVIDTKRGKTCAVLLLIGPVTKCREFSKSNAKHCKMQNQSKCELFNSIDNIRVLGIGLELARNGG